VEQQRETAVLQVVDEIPQVAGFGVPAEQGASALHRHQLTGRRRTVGFVV
jgi:hypothetical protein